MRLRLQSNPHMLDRAAEHRVREPRERTGSIILRVAQRLGLRVHLGDGFAGGGGILSLEVAARVVEAAELDADAGTDADEGGEGAFVEGGGAFVGEDRARAGEG